MGGESRATKRCSWCGTDPTYVAYHDDEWGVPERDDRALFEKLILDGFQAGLSWIIVLKKREHIRKVFDDFDPAKIVRYRKAKVERLLNDPGIIRNRAKVESCVTSAKAYLELESELGSFSDYLWSFTNGQTIQNRWRREREIPSQSKESQAMAKDLKKRGFRFCGPTITYAFMQAVGMVNDHLVDCFCYEQVQKLAHTGRKR